jgi:FKBP-type peptidyl-prolyl cis-trans isomerase
MRFYILVFAGLLFLGLTACNKKSETLLLAERAQIRAYFEQEGISNYIEDNDAGYFYHITENGDSTLDRANIASKVELKYESWLLEGTLIDDTYANTSTILTLSSSIPGLQLVLPNFYIGTKARVVLPSRLGYGEAGLSPLIPSNSILMIDVEIIEIHPHF